MTRPLHRKVLVAAFVSMVVTAVLVAAVIAVSVRTRTDAALALRTEGALTQLDRLMAGATDAETGQRGYVLTGDRRFLEPFEWAATSLPGQLDTLRSLLADRENLRLLVDSLEETVRVRLDQVENVLRVFDEAGHEAARDLITAGEGKRSHDRLRSIVRRLSDDQESRLSARTRASIRLATAGLLAVAALGLFTMLFVGSAARFIARDARAGDRHIAREARAGDRLRFRLAESLELQQAVMEGVDHAIIVGDENGVTGFNAGAERLLGYDRSEVVGRMTAERFHDAAEVARRARELSTELGRVVEPGMDVFLTKPREQGPEHREWTYLRRDGTRVPVDLTVSPVRRPDGSIHGFFVIARDISTWREAERALVEANESLRVAKERAESADRLKSLFLATMSHELRTPLNSIPGFTGVLQKELPGPLNEEQRRQLAMVRSAARHLLALISDVLDPSRIEAGQFTLDDAPFDPDATVARVAGTMAPLAEQKGLGLEVASDPVGQSLRGDARRFEQVLPNLVGNAVKFTDRGTITMLAAVVPGHGESDSGPAGDHHGAPDRRLRIDVSDTGPGIDPTDQERIFRPFSQVESGLERRHDGTGLGLSISRRLAELMGGRLEVASEPGAPSGMPRAQKPVSISRGTRRSTSCSSTSSFPTWTATPSPVDSVPTRAPAAYPSWR